MEKNIYEKLYESQNDMNVLLTYIAILLIVLISLEQANTKIYESLDSTYQKYIIVKEKEIKVYDGMMLQMDRALDLMEEQE